MKLQAVILLVAVSAGALLAAASVPGVIPTTAGVYYACYANHANQQENQGSVRMVSNPALCRASETAISWNAGGQGPIGPIGPVGPVGPAGPRGLQGLDGAAGPAGVAGPAGAEGVAGPQGPMGPAGGSGGAAYYREAANIDWVDALDAPHKWRQVASLTVPAGSYAVLFTATVGQFPVGIVFQPETPHAFCRVASGDGTVRAGAAIVESSNQTATMPLTLQAFATSNQRMTLVVNCLDLALGLRTVVAQGVLSAAQRDVVVAAPSCSNDSDCGADATCGAAGECEARDHRLADGAACSNDSECQIENCDAGLCQLSPDGSACGYDSECAIGNCAAGVCGRSPLGAACTRADECADGGCEPFCAVNTSQLVPCATVCVPASLKAAGAACTASFECDSQLCYQGVCTLKHLDDRCADSSDCAYGLCELICECPLPGGCP